MKNLMMTSADKGAVPEPAAQAHRRQEDHGDIGVYTGYSFLTTALAIPDDGTGEKMYDELPVRAAVGCDPSVVSMHANRALVFSYKVAFVESGVE
uniref:Uncharacterized protein n=1 Tax=Oryza meridionalis TaxID=40149 RepID=A0A0E0D816_9ORYZ